MNEPSLLYFLLVVSFFAIVTAPLYQYVKKKRRDLFEPIYLAVFAFLLMFWFRSVYILTWGSELVGDAPFPPDILRAWSVSWLYLLLAIVLFYKSYYSRLGERVARALAPLPGQWRLGHAYTAICILFSVGSAALLILIRQFGSLASYLFLKSEVYSTLGTGPLVLLEQCLALSMQVAYTVWVTRRSRGAQVTFALVAIPAIIAQAVQGMKGAFLFMLLSLLMLRHYLVRPIRLRFVLLFAVAGIFLVFPAFTALRGASDLAGYQQGWEDYLDPVRVLDVAAQRFSGIEALVFIVGDTPRVMNYQFGKTYLSLLVSWIPREVWPDKPVLGFGQLFTPLYLGDVFAPGGTTYAPTIFGEAYVNFHVAGIILVAILGGIFLRAFYEYLIVRNNNISAIVIYAITLPYVLVGLEAHSVAWLTTGWLFMVSRGLSFFVAERKFGSRRTLGTRIVRAQR